MGDFHCGHECGLTPPRWQFTPEGDSEDWTKREKYAKLQQEAWDWYEEAIQSYGPFDIVVVNGDAIDGCGYRSGGTELIVRDRLEQAKMATECIDLAINPKTDLYLIYGTPYHTGHAEDYEAKIASTFEERGVNVKVGAHEWIDMNGVMFDFKHHVGSSSVPHGRHTAISKELLWSRLWSDSGMQPRTDVLCRSHVHYFQYCGDTDGGLRMTLPALQCMGSKYGSRLCSGKVDFGFVVFEVEKGGGLQWTEVLCKLDREKAEPSVYRGD
jgi:hypothetical protein